MSLLNEGDVIRLERGHTIRTTLPAHCVYANRIGIWQPVDTAVTIGEAVGGLATDWLEGEYVVVNAGLAGGGVAMGNDVYSPGHRVIAERLLPSGDPRWRVTFYQSGAFDTCLPHLEPIGRAQARWEVTTVES